MGLRTTSDTRWARAPASAANLGPGLDALALALRLPCEVAVEPADRLQVTTIGEGAGLPADDTHLAARVAVEVTGHDRWSITVRSSVPVARGLGSSAALALATAAALGADDPLAVAAAFDGHAENAAAAASGGLVVATRPGDGRSGPVTATRLRLDPALVFVVIVPERSLPTSRARRALPEQVPLADATFNIGRVALLQAGLADHSVLVPEAMSDRLHQNARSSLFPEADALRQGLVGAGALAVCTSGAGPSVLAACERSHGQALQEAGRRLLAEAGLAGQARLLEADLEGLLVGPGPSSPSRAHNVPCL